MKNNNSTFFNLICRPIIIGVAAFLVATLLDVMRRGYVRWDITISIGLLILLVMFFSTLMDIIKRKKNIPEVEVWEDLDEDREN